MEPSRALIQRAAHGSAPVYGVNTGFGALKSVRIPEEDVERLQANLVRSHAAGMGPELEPKAVRLMLALRAHSLALGASGVRVELVERLLSMLEKDCLPVVPSRGSLGASGDLIPLAHLALGIIGEGEIRRNGAVEPAASALANAGLGPIALQAKEGLALINGTSAMTGLGALVVDRALDQVRQAETITALVIEALQGSTSPFLPEGHDVARPHQGQIDTAANMRDLMRGSEAAVEHAELRRQVQAGKQNGKSVQRTNVYLQKAYSLRAIPQILGGVRDTLYHARLKLDIELNSANDNPLFFEGEEIFHGANFHGQPIAFVMDFVTIALTQLGVLSERRTNRLLNRHLSYGLPEFLVMGEPGLNSGFAGAQYPATALVAENRTIGPASTQSIPSNGDNQDVVSMGLISARNARRVLQNNQHILAVELIAAAQAVDLSQRYDKLSPAARATYDAVRALVPTLERDRFMADDIEAVAASLAGGKVLESVRNSGVALR